MDRVEEMKQRRLETWTRKLEEAKATGDEQQIRLAEAKIWHINQTY